VLAAQGLISTSRGGGGGSTVLELEHRDVMRMLEANMRHLLTTRGCSKEEMEEVRELIDVTAAWMAASRRSPAHVERLRECIPAIKAGEQPTRAQIDVNLRFHYEVLEATGNRLLHIFGEPVSVLIYSFYRTAEHAPKYYQRVLADHHRILAAIEARDPTAARRAMSDHICNLREDTAGSRAALAGLTFD
jgi:DNA-binding FadR family transcriptional regulator